MRLAGKYVDPANQYEECAEFVASTYGSPLSPMLLRALVHMPEHVFSDIESNPQDWDRRVNEYLYGLANSA